MPILQHNFTVRLNSPQRLEVDVFCVEITSKPSSVAQLDARLTGDQEVAGSTPAGSATFFRGDWIKEYFHGHSLPSADSRRAVVSFWRKNVHNTP